MKLGLLAESGIAVPSGSADIDIEGLTADSRAVQRGYLFAALPGAKFDGVCFAADAKEKGAVAVLVSEEGSLPEEIGVPVVRAADPRRALALMAARFFGNQPETVTAVTGTNGKTSVAAFTRQIWQGLGHQAASLGTVGVVTASSQQRLSHTTPEPVELHRLLAQLAGEGVSHLALEASSHGLQQRRLDGVTLKASAFTNISRDHLDYHADFEDYFSQKLRLFSELSYDEGAHCVADADSEGAKRVIETAKARGLTVLTVGRAGDAIRLVGSERAGFAQTLTLDCSGRVYKVVLPLAGDFQVSNALVAAGLVLATGGKEEAVFSQLERLTGALGRLEYAGTAPSGAPVFIDYAHTPDAVTNALKALRPYAKERLAIVFGCGGDRDRGKRPHMGEAAVNGADIVYVTDDNPRSEDPDAIRKEIMDAAQGAIEIGNRREAIATAISRLGAQDLLLVAGKGHETGQIIGDNVLPFSDHEAVTAALTQIQEGAQ